MCLQARHSKLVERLKAVNNEQISYCMFEKNKMKNTMIIDIIDYFCITVQNLIHLNRNLMKKCYRKINGFVRVIIIYIYNVVVVKKKCLPCIEINNVLTQSLKTRMEDKRGPEIALKVHLEVFAKTLK